MALTSPRCIGIYSHSRLSFFFFAKQFSHTIFYFVLENNKTFKNSIWNFSLHSFFLIDFYLLDSDSS